MSDAPLVRLRDAAFGYRGVPVVSHVDLDVRPGALVGILGPNGSGKSTLVRGLLGLLPPLAGTVERADAPVGYVPQRDALDAVYPVSVGEVVESGAYGRLTRWRRRLRPEDRRLADESLARVGLADRRRALVASLSGGQRQRVLIARALCMRPRLLLLDEPTAGVDQPTQRLVLDLLARLNREDGLAVLFVTHEVAPLRGVAQEVLWVAGGRVTRGPADELLRPERLEALHGGAAAAGAWS